MIEEVRDYFLSCPAIKRRAKIFGINNLGPDALDYTVESVPGNPIVKRYTNGASIRAKQFVIASRELHSVAAKTQARNVETFDAVCAWVEEQNAEGNYPKISEGQPLEVVVNSSAYLLGVDGKTARYQIQVQLNYFTEGSTI